MSATRAYVDGRPVWIPVDDGVDTRDDRRIGGSFVAPAPKPVDKEAERLRSAARREATRRYYEANRERVMQRQREYRARGRDELGHFSGPAIPCGAPMPMVGALCARTAGHKTEHRSRYSMDNALRMKSGRGA